MDAYEYIIPPVQEYRRVPLLLFQTWQTSTLPPLMSRCVHDLITSNPEFKYQFYDDIRCRSFIQMHFDADVLHAYDTLIPGAYKADLWRYCILYVYGGIYVDIKYRCVPPFKLIELTTREHFVRDREFWGIDGIYQALLSCYPRNPILYKCIRKIVEYVYRMEYGKTCLFIGPHLVRSHFCNLELKQMELSFNGPGIQRGNKLILTMYPEYRRELKQFATTPHYTELWMERCIYHIKKLHPYQVDDLSKQREMNRHTLWASHPVRTPQGLLLQWTNSVYREGEIRPCTMVVHTLDGVILPYSKIEQLRYFQGQYTGLLYTNKYHVCMCTEDATIIKPDFHASLYSESHWCMTTYKGNPCVVYEWYPLQICNIKEGVLSRVDTLYTTPDWFYDLKASTNCVEWKGSQWVVLTRCYLYKKKGLFMKTYHMLVEIDLEFQIKYSEFFTIGEMSKVSDLQVTSEGMEIGYTESKGRCYWSKYTWEEVNGLRWTRYGLE